MTPWFLLILTIIFWGTAPILDKIALNKGTPLQGLVIRSAAIMIVLCVGLLLTGRFKEAFCVDTKSMVLFSASGIVAGLLGVFTYYSALKTGNASRIVPLASVYPMIAFILSILFLKENFTATKLLGTLFVILGIFLLK
jgi:transporter family protein